MRKPTICICEKKDAKVIAQLISTFVFDTVIVLYLFYLYPKFQDSSFMLSLCSLVCVGPVQKPNCSFSNDVAQILVCFSSPYVVHPLVRGYPKTICLCASILTNPRGNLPNSSPLSQTYWELLLK